MHSGQHEHRESPATGGIDTTEDGEEQPVSTGRTRRSTQQNGVKRKSSTQQHIEGYNALDDMEDESDAASSGGDWDGADDDEVDDNIVDEEDDADVDMSDDAPSLVDEEEAGKDVRNRMRSLVVSLRYQRQDPSPISGLNQDESPLKLNSDLKQAFSPEPEPAKTLAHPSMHNETTTRTKAENETISTEPQRNTSDQTFPYPANGHAANNSTLTQSLDGNPPATS